MDIAGRATRISGGDLTVSVTKSDRSDEIGTLANAFGQMVDNLRTQIKQIFDGVNVSGGVGVADFKHRNGSRGSNIESLRRSFGDEHHS